jgi:NAD-dependent SIR2 family protein deacetylase
VVFITGDMAYKSTRKGGECNMATFYCVKCKAKKDVDDSKVEKITMKNGRPASKSVCPDCGTKVFKIGG